MKLLRALETIEGCITKGRLYSELREYTGNQGCVIIKDDCGDESTLFKERFEEIATPIIFSSKEDFENAVMEVVLERLLVQTTLFDLFGRKLQDQYSRTRVYDILEDKL